MVGHGRTWWDRAVEIIEMTERKVVRLHIPRRGEESSSSELSLSLLAYFQSSGWPSLCPVIPGLGPAMRNKKISNSSDTFIVMTLIISLLAGLGFNHNIFSSAGLCPLVILILILITNN